MTRRRKIITEEAPTLGKTVLLLRASNPFGNGGSAKAIVDIVERLKEEIYEPADTAVFQPAHLSVTEF